MTTSSLRRRRRNSQRGSAMLVTMIIIGALLAGAAVLVSLQLSANRSTDLTRSGMSSLYCAEAGIAAARPFVANGYPSWAAALSQSAGETIGNYTDSPFLASPIIDHDLDGDGSDDFTVAIVDNDDEPAGNIPGVDSDLTVYIVSRCTKYADTQVEVRELVLFNAGTTPFTEQLGGGTGINAVVTPP